MSKCKITIWDRAFDLSVVYECYAGEEVLESQKEAFENIFKYVMPKSIFVPHTKKHRIAAIMCNYKFDMEHGIAVVFENGKLKKVGTQDIVL